MARPLVSLERSGGTQETDVVAAYRRAGFLIDRIVRKGKWITLLATRAEA